MKEWGWTTPILIDEAGGIIAGHGRVMAAQKLGLAEIPCMVARGWTEAQKKAYVIADNKLALNAGWDESMLRVELEELQDLGFDLGITGFSSDELATLLVDDYEEESGGGLTDADSVPETQEVEVSKTGDVWILGNHRVMCGDSLSPVDVKTLMGGKKAQLIHADPPYGMGKQADGVANDNIYGEKLDAFQMGWWRAFRAHTEDTGSAYIWGNAPDLWRLWYRGGLADSETLELRNEIVWDKKCVPGMASGLMTQFAEATERCLFIQIGSQFIQNLNSDQYWEGWDEIRGYLEAEAKAAGLDNKRCKELLGVGMFSHWFTKSQWTLIPENHYAKLAELTGRFAKPYAEIRATYDRIKGGYRDYINGLLGDMRAFFDNAHSVMYDVWEFPRVLGDERHGHATPKPVAMMERVMLTSCPKGGIVSEPFGGSGSTLMGAEKTGRACYTMELQAKYVDVIVRRWQAFTGKQAKLEATGQTFDEVKAKRLGGER